MREIAKLVWEDGKLVASAPNLPALAWARPAELAEARLNCESPLTELALETGGDLLAAAFKVVPFVREPLPRPTFGDAVTPAARAAFTLFLGQNVDHTADAFRVLRGEPDDFLVCARRYHDVWKVGGFTVAATTLTVRFEDLWNLIPEGRRFRNYLVEVHRDPNGADSAEAQAHGIVDETLTDIAPDARICLDLAAGGGFTLTFWPIVACA
ncbi:MAG: glycoside hydrolase family 97 C-terminal domain-containing protein [Kiritimatiellae bacterium]|nr:glycoside hydrolase family 97 C-terminal domain-containing protein [Kiritimatiellia bacterium]